MRPVGLFAIFVTLLTIVSSHDDDIHTVTYNTENFSEELAKNNHFVMFYAPWCGHCKRLAPTWEQLAEMLNEDDSNVRIAKVDCTVDSTVCSDNDVTGYPTLKFFKLGETEGVKFKGMRDLPSLTTFINQQTSEGDLEEESETSGEPQIVNGLVDLTEDNFDKHVSSGKHFVKFYAPWCGHCQKLAPIWEELAQSLESDNSVGIAKVDCTQHRNVCNQFDVKGYPTLLWIEDGKKIDKYQGARAQENLKTYIKEKMGSGSADSGSNEDDSKTDNTSAVINLTSDNFDSVIENGVSFIKFFAPWCGHCKRLAPTWEELGEKFSDNDQVTIAKVDCTLENSKQLCTDQEVEGFPTVFLYKSGKKISEYSGNRSLKDFETFITKHTVHDEL